MLRIIKHTRQRSDMGTRTMENAFQAGLGREDAISSLSHLGSYITIEERRTTRGITREALKGMSSPEWPSFVESPKLMEKDYKLGPIVSFFLSCFTTFIFVYQSKYFFLTGGSPAHYGRVMRELLYSELPKSWLGKGCPIKLPARSLSTPLLVSFVRIYRK